MRAKTSQGDLVAAMTAGDEDAFQVHADRLLEDGDPRGELIQLQVRLEKTPADKGLLAAERALFEKHGAEWLPQVSGIDAKRTTYRRGFLESVTLRKATPLTVGTVVDHPSAAFLRRLEISAGFRMTPAIILRLARRSLPALRSLTLEQGVMDFDDPKPDPADPTYPAGWGFGQNQDRGNVLWKALPNLESLRLAAFQVIGALTHPKLAELSISGTPICDSRWSLPRLESLTWELGADETGTGIDGAAYMVEAIWVAKLPALRRLDLSGCGSMYDEEAAEEEGFDEDPCAASLRPIDAFRQRAKQLDELVLPARRLTGRKAIEAWLTGK